MHSLSSKPFNCANLGSLTGKPEFSKAGYGLRCYDVLIRPCTSFLLYQNCRRPFKDFLYQFKFIDLGITESKSLDPRVASEKLIERCKLAKGEYQVRQCRRPATADERFLHSL